MRAIAQDYEMLDELCRRTTGNTAEVVEATLAANPGLAKLGPRVSAFALAWLQTACAPL